MGYLNPIVAMGPDRFAAEAAAAGVDGVIVVDMPPEEGEPLLTALRERGIDPVFLLSPTTSTERMRRIRVRGHRVPLLRLAQGDHGGRPSRHGRGRGRARPRARGVRPSGRGRLRHRRRGLRPPHRLHRRRGGGRLGDRAPGRGGAGGPPPGSPTTSRRSSRSFAARSRPRPARDRKPEPVSWFQKLRPSRIRTEGTGGGKGEEHPRGALDQVPRLRHRPLSRGAGPQPRRLPQVRPSHAGRGAPAARPVPRSRAGGRRSAPT